MGVTLRRLAGFLALAAAALCGGCRHAPPAARAAAIERAPYDPALASRLVAGYEERVRRDPRSALDYNPLSAAYLQRSRETGDVADAVQGERAARRSLAIRTKRNEAALLALAQCLSAQHRFAEALSAARKAEVVAPGFVAAQRLQAELLIEIGEYDEAKKLLAQSAGPPQDAGYLALTARMLQIDGQAEQARLQLVRARDAAEALTEIPRENLSWFHRRLAEQLEVMGRAAESRREFDAAISLFPRDYKAMLGIARLSAASGDHAAAVQSASAASEIVPTPDGYGLIGDEETARGNRTAAEQAYRMVDAIAKLARAQGTVYDRQRALFCADHGRPSEGLRLARAEMRVRHDVYAWDTLAWCAFRAGKLPEAREAMRKALARGTQDPLLRRHAEAIARAPLRP